jgi:23S rRNA (pseudouridine1915-N3)-methyltransferase
MKVRIIVASKIKDKEYLSLYNEFSKRLTPYLKCELIDFKIPDRIDIEKSLILEADKLYYLSEGYYRIALDVGGKQIDTVEFSNNFSKWKDEGKNVAFLIGSAYGLNDNLKKKVDVLFSLSKLTMAHKIAFLVLIEQVYRAVTIINGHPYHK